MLELPCIAHCHAEGHGQLAATLDTNSFDYVVITSPEVRMPQAAFPLWRRACEEQRVVH